MTSSFYFLRHGATLANASGLLCGGGWDIDLSDLGIKQTSAAAGILCGFKHGIKTVCYSPLLRTRQTKDILTPALPGASFVEVSDLREWDIGAWDRQKVGDILKPDDDFLSMNPPSGEPSEVFKKRVEQTVETCLKYPAAVLIVAHGCVGGMVLKKFGLTNAHLENATLYKIDLESVPRLIKYPSPPAPN